MTFNAAGQIGEILKQYEKHGWTLRRVLLCAPTRSGFSTAPAALENLFGDAPVVDFETDALWFSRLSADGREAWELRRLKGAAYALIKVFAAGQSETEREQIRSETEKALVAAK